MENQIVKYYIHGFKKYKEVKNLEDYILFQNCSETNTKQFSPSEIINLSNTLGKSLLKYINLNPFTINNKSNLIITFVDFYKKYGYISNKNFTSENKNTLIIPFEEIEYLTQFFSKFHILYTIFDVTTQPTITDEQSKELIKYAKLLNLNIENINTSNYKKIYYDFIEIVKPYLNYEINLKFDLDFDDYGIYTKIISKSICDLCVFIFTNMISSNIVGKKSTCKHCGNPYLKTGKKQYYCHKCQNTKNYNKTLDKNKLDIIDKLEYQYNHYDFSKEISQELRSYIKLKQDSRLRLKTKLKELKLFLDKVTNSRIKEKSTINSGYNDY